MRGGQGGGSGGRPGKAGGRAGLDADTIAAQFTSPPTRVVDPKAKAKLRAEAEALLPAPSPGSPRASKVAKCHTFGNLALELAHQGRYWARSFARLERASRRF